MFWDVMMRIYDSKKGEEDQICRQDYMKYYTSQYVDTAIIEASRQRGTADMRIHAKCGICKIYAFRSSFLGTTRNYRKMEDFVKITCDGEIVKSNNTQLIVKARNNTVYIDKSAVNTEEPKNECRGPIEIRTHLSVLIPKKLKVALVLNLLLVLLSISMSFTIGYLSWVQIELLKEQVNLKIEKDMKNILESYQETMQQVLHVPRVIGSDYPASEGHNFDNDVTQNDDMESQNMHNDTLSPKDLLVVHFNGAQHEANLGLDPIIGPWTRDLKVSSAKSHNKIRLDNNYVTIKEGGLYLIYAQIVYLTHEPSCFFIWGRRGSEDPRLLTTCATSGSSERPLAQSQISCSVQIVTRLYDNDIVNIAQREKNRTVWLRPGYSYFGFVKLRS
ncbi:uncharacterized protein LOC131845949 [Achroia grisella]|uniref:uncharacterized protein LOC131845949 n=1 Tax=Achroia grisella TaxID=688607 RepID=UPI0027D2ECAF|nr:uncharacterized protein LOC131845949 [Achroia grisella]